MPLLVIPDNEYGEKVPFQLLSVITIEELQQAGETWKQVHLSTVLSKQNKVTSSNVPKYDLDKVQEKIQKTTKVVIPLFKSVMVKGKVKLNMHSKCINILIETVFMLFRTYGHNQNLRGV